MSRTLVAACVLCLTAFSASQGQVVIVQPNDRMARPPVRTQFRIQEVDINATIRDQAATVQMAQVFENLSSSTVQAQFLFPMPDGAAISDLTLIVDGKELAGELKRSEEARRIYENIVRQRKDPALLEYIGNGLFRTSVFPIPPHQKRRVEIRYTQLLKKDTGLVDFTLPLGTLKHSGSPIEKATVTVRIDTSEPIKTVYSPTHEFSVERPGETRARCSLTLNQIARPNDVRLLFGTRGGDVGMNLVTYRSDPTADGYFLLLASPRVKGGKNTHIPKTVLFVVDRSGSMSGEKIEQAKASLRYMIGQLGDKDTFNIVSYSSDVDLFREELEVVTETTRREALAYVDDIYSGGGTNINDALSAALSQLKDQKRPSYVLFLTDGLPTVGVRDEKQIAANARQANAVGARVFSFGVGYDVNSRLLDRLSRDQRGTSVYVKPSEDIEVAATNLFRKVSSPVLTDVRVDITLQQHDSSRKPVRQVYPRKLTDLFRGEQLVMVGRYSSAGPARVVLRGDVSGRERRFELEATLAGHSQTDANEYVEKLWATRRIGEIIDDLDLNGRNQELIDELVALSLRHGIMTPYTSFLADEGVRLTDSRRNRTQAAELLERLSESSGESAFFQRDMKRQLQSARSAADTAESFGLPASGGRGRGTRLSLGQKASDAAGSPSDLNRGGEVATRRHEAMRRIGSKTFYWKDARWLDADLGEKRQDVDSKVIEIRQFSPEYFELAAKDKGKWARYLALQEPVEILLEGRRYRILPPEADVSGK